MFVSRVLSERQGGSRVSAGLRCFHDSIESVIIGIKLFLTLSSLDSVQLALSTSIDRFLFYTELDEARRHFFTCSGCS